MFDPINPRDPFQPRETRRGVILGVGKAHFFLFFCSILICVSLFFDSQQGFVRKGEGRIGKGKVERRRWGGEDRKGGGLCLIYVFFCYVPEKGGWKGRMGGMGLGQILFFFFAFVS